MSSSVVGFDESGCYCNNVLTGMDSADCLSQIISTAIFVVDFVIT